jgi:hypothetical protein
MKRRSGLETTEVESGGLRICPNTLLTWDGSGSTVIVVSYKTPGQQLLMKIILDNGMGVEGISEDWLCCRNIKIIRKSPKTGDPNLDHG